MKLTYWLIAGFLLSANAAAKTEVETQTTTAEHVSITWENPSDYKDIEATSELQSRFNDHFFKTITKTLEKDIKAKLKSGQRLEMTVTDVDLAGDVRSTFGVGAINEIRVVKDLYPPKIIFSYRVLENDSVIVAGDETLTDLGFMNNIHRIISDDFFYEETLLKEWFMNTVAPKL